MNVFADAYCALFPRAKEKRDSKMALDSVCTLIYKSYDCPQDEKDAAFDEIRRMGKDAIPALHAQLESIGVYNRGTASLLLAEIEGAPALPFILTAVKKEEFDSAVDQEIRAIAKIGGADALIGLANCENEQLALNVISKLHYTNDASVVPFLLSLLQAPSVKGDSLHQSIFRDSKRNNARHSLVELGSIAIPALVNLIAIRESCTFMAAGIIARMRGEPTSISSQAAISHLFNALLHDDSDRVDLSIIPAIVHLGAEYAAIRFLTDLTRKDPGNRARHTDMIQSFGRCIAAAKNSGQSHLIDNAPDFDAFELKRFPAKGRVIQPIKTPILQQKRQLCPAN